MLENNGNKIKRNAKELQSKSKAHQVFPIDPVRRVYKVISGGSGTEYQVVMFPPDYGGGHCTCNWATKRPAAVSENGGRVGCSHVLAVESFIAQGEGKVISAWSDEEQARKQKAKTEDVGDGLVLTQRKARGKRRVQADFFFLLR